MTNPLQIKSLVRRTSGAVAAALMVACGGHRGETAPLPTAPLPTAGFAAQAVGVLPLTLLAAEDSLNWQALIGARHAALTKADSVISTLLKTRAPEVTWVTPEELRRAARRAPGVAPDPDQMGTAILFRSANLAIVPDPLRSELRTLVALAGSGGGRYAFVPAGLIFRRPEALGAGGSVLGGPHGAGVAELTVVLVDVRTGRIGFRTVARGEGDDPWTALTGAVKGLTPGLP